jgi:hypothetical protein
MTPTIKAIPYRAVTLIGRGHVQTTVTDLAHVDLLAMAVERWAVTQKTTEAAVRGLLFSEDLVPYFTSDVSLVTLEQRG